MTREGKTPNALLPVYTPSPDGTDTDADRVGTDAEIVDISMAPYRGTQTSFHKTDTIHWICDGSSSFESLTALAADRPNWPRGSGSKVSRIEIHDQLTTNISQFVHTMLHYVSNYGSLRPTHLFLGHSGGLRREYRYRVYSNKKVFDENTSYSKAMPSTSLLEYLKAEVDGSTVPTTTTRPGLTEEQLRHVNLAYAKANQESYLEMETRAICVAPSWHYHAKALDLMWVAWGGTGEFGREWLTYSRPCVAKDDVALGSVQHRRIVAVEAALRKSFGTVLQRDYNWAHRNHFHADIGTPVAPDFGKGASASNNLFLRDCIRAFTDYALDHNKKWDDDAKAGYAVLLTDLGMEGLDPQRNVDDYLLFLNFIMMHGFADKRAGHYRWRGGIF